LIEMIVGTGNEFVDHSLWSSVDFVVGLAQSTPTVIHRLLDSREPCSQRTTGW